MKTFLAEIWNFSFTIGRLEVKPELFQDASREVTLPRSHTTTFKSYAAPSVCVTTVVPCV